MKTRGLILAFFFMLSAMAGSAQAVQITVKPLTDDDIKLFRQDVQSIKDDVIRDTMQFNDTEATAFWPVYKEYAAGQHAIAPPGGCAGYGRRDRRGRARGLVLGLGPRGRSAGWPHEAAPACLGAVAEMNVSGALRGVDEV